MATKQDFRITGIGDVITKRLNDAGMYTREDIKRFVNSYGVCELLHVMGVGPKKGARMVKTIGVESCTACGCSVDVGALEPAYDAVVRGKQCPNESEAQKKWAKAKPEEEFHDPEKAVIPWVGGKTSLIDAVLPQIPPHEVYVEPFAGSGAIFLAKQPVAENVLNDKDKMLIKSYEKLKDKGEILVDISPSKSRFYKVKEKGEGRSVEEWLYLLKVGFGNKSPSSKALSYPGDEGLRRFKTKKWELQAPERFGEVRLRSGDYHDVIDEFDSAKTFTYVDPPYHETSNPYSDDSLTPYELRHTLENCKGNVLVSYNNHPDVRKAFSGWEIKEIPVRHSLQGGSHSQKELLIANYKLK